MFTHSFPAVLLPARFDDVPWTRVLAEQSADGLTGWVEVLDQPVTPDPTPESPTLVGVTITQATLERAWFRFRGDVTPSNPSPPGAPLLSPPPAYMPTVEQVAAILRARTRGPASRDALVAGEQGAFTTTTRPTYAEVQALTYIAASDLAGMMGGRTPCKPELVVSAASSAAYRAAQLVEISYYPEQTDDDTTAFKALSKLWDDSSKATVAAVAASCPLTTTDGEVAGLPVGHVPLRQATGWGTRW